LRKYRKAHDPNAEPLVKGEKSNEYVVHKALHQKSNKIIHTSISNMHGYGGTPEVFKIILVKYLFTKKTMDHMDSSVTRTVKHV
jgi:hypothetical protein